MTIFYRPGGGQGGLGRGRGGHGSATDYSDLFLSMS